MCVNHFLYSHFLFYILCSILAIYPESPLHVVTTTDVNTDNQSQQLPENEDADELDEFIPSRKEQVKSQHTFLQIWEVFKKVFRIIRNAVLFHL